MERPKISGFKQITHLYENFDLNNKRSGSDPAPRIVLT
jgi:hypothetical protein